MRNDMNPSTPAGGQAARDREPWWAGWLAGPVDAFLAAGLFCMGLTALLLFWQLWSLNVTLVVVMVVWVALMSGYYALRRLYNWYDDVPLVFGREPPFAISTSRFTVMYLAYVLARQRDRFELETMVARAQSIASLMEDGYTKVFLFRPDPLGSDSAELDLSLALEVRSLASSGTLLPTSQGSYQITEAGKRFIRKTAVEAFETDSFIMEELAAALGTTKEALCASKPAA